MKVIQFNNRQKIEMHDHCIKVITKDEETSDILTIFKREIKSLRKADHEIVSRYSTEHKFVWGKGDITIYREGAQDEIKLEFRYIEDRDEVYDLLKKDILRITK